MIGRTTLLINPPLVNGVAFTRQGRCQERDEVLGTTKPPYSLIVIASLFRQLGIDFRVIDQTAERSTTESVIERLDAESFTPGLIVFCSTTPTLVLRRERDGEAEAPLRRAAGLLRPARLGRPRRVDGTRPRRRRHDRGRTGGRGGRHRPARIAGRRLRHPGRGAAAQRHGGAPHRTRRVHGVPRHADAGVGPAAADALPAAARQRAVRADRNQPRLSLQLRLLRGPAPPRPQVPRALREGARRRDRASQARTRHPLLLPLGRHGDAEREDVQPVLRRADRAEPGHPVARQRARRQPRRPGVRQAAQAVRAAGCSRWASSPSRTPCART